MEIKSDFHFPDKVFLTGADNFFLMLESNTEKYSSGNNVIRICLFFESQSDADLILENISNSLFIHWICNIKLIKERFYNRAFWKYHDDQKQIATRTHQAETDKIIPDQLLNRAIRFEKDGLIECDIIEYKSGKVGIVISLHHILIDGRGSGLLMRHLAGDLPFNTETKHHFFPKEEQKKPFYSYVMNMYKVKRFIRHSTKGKIASVAFKEAPLKEENSFSLTTIYFTQEETELIDNNARKMGARFGANNFLIACCAKVINDVNIQRDTKGVLWIPIPYDGRKRGGIGPVITNFISFLFYRLDTGNVNDLSETVQNINRQMTEQLKLEIPKKYNLLLDMMRHIPLGLYRFLIKRSSKGSVASFLFTSAGEDYWDMNSLIKNSYIDINIIPPYSDPPGIIFSFLRNSNCLKMNIVSTNRHITNAELEFIKSTIVTTLSNK
jgi:hypothetical protein